MSKRAGEEYIVPFRPKPVFKPSIRKQPNNKPQETATSRSSEGAQGPKSTDVIPEQSSSSSAQAPSFPPSPPRRDTPNIIQPAEPDRFNFRFSADREFKEKFDRLAEVLGVENPLRHMAEVLEKALEVALDKKDPKRKLERRLERERKGESKKEGEAKSRPDEISEKTSAKKGSIAHSRYISSEVRERIYARAKYHCEFMAPDGTCCTARTGLV